MQNNVHNFGLLETGATDQLLAMHQQLANCLTAV
jgi:hypothetical protein